MGPSAVWLSMANLVDRSPGYAGGAHEDHPIPLLPRSSRSSRSADGDGALICLLGDDEVPPVEEKGARCYRFGIHAKHHFLVVMGIRSPVGGHYFPLCRFRGSISAIRPALVSKIRLICVLNKDEIDGMKRNLFYFSADCLFPVGSPTRPIGQGTAAPRYPRGPSCGGSEMSLSGGHGSCIR